MKWNILLGIKQLFQKHDFPKNIIVTASHGSSRIPWAVFPQLTRTYQLSPRLLLNFSDYGTKHLLQDVPPKQKVVAKYGRIIGDPNRARDDENIVRFEDFGGVKIFRDKFRHRLTSSWFRRFWLKKLLNLSYWPFYDESFKAVELAIKNTKDSSDSPIIFIDVHDTGNRILGRRLEFDTWRDVGFMPKVAIANAPDEETGKDQLGTAPVTFITAFKKKLADKLGIQEEEVSINKPYQGGNVVRFFGNPYHNRKLRRILKGRKIIAVQLEFDRGMYLDEVSQKPILWKIQSVKNSLMATLKEMENFNFSEIDELE